MRGIGLGGMRVDAAIPLAVNRPVELLLRAPGNDSPQTHRWRATVRHISPDGVGLKYEPAVLTELPTLLELLQDADRQAMERAEERTEFGLDSGLGHTLPVPAPSTGLRHGRRIPEREP